MLHIFDLDDVLIHEGFDISILTDHAFDICHFLHSQGHRLAIASHNEEAEKILEITGLKKFFSIILGYEDDTYKVSHVLKISTELNVSVDEIWFYDDLEANVEAVSQLGVKSVIVNWKIGLTWTNITN